MKTTVRKDVARGVVRVRPKLALQGHPSRLLQEVVSNNTDGMSVSSCYGQVSSWCLGTAFPHMYDVRIRQGYVLRDLMDSGRCVSTCMCQILTRVAAEAQL
jgi:hypothetical protein